MISAQVHLIGLMFLVSYSFKHQLFALLLHSNVFIIKSINFLFVAETIILHCCRCPLAFVFEVKLKSVSLRLERSQLAIRFLMNLLIPSTFDNLHYVSKWLAAFHCKGFSCLDTSFHGWSSKRHRINILRFHGSTCTDSSLAQSV